MRKSAAAGAADGACAHRGQAGRHARLRPRQSAQGRRRGPAALPAHPRRRRAAALHEGQRPAGTGEGDRQRRQSADRPRDGQPHLAAPLRQGHRRHAVELRRSWANGRRTPNCSITSRRRFIAGGWSIKAIHREILLSATYQLGCIHDERNAAVDPGNRLYWRMDRERLDVESWRDALAGGDGQSRPHAGRPDPPT